MINISTFTFKLYYFGHGSLEKVTSVMFTVNRAALHWAAKRGHKDIVEVLLEHNADRNLVNEKGETPLSLATRPEVRIMLGGEPTIPNNVNSDSLPIAPNYLKNPPLNGKTDVYHNNGIQRRRQSASCELSTQQNSTSSLGHGQSDGMCMFYN